MKYTVELIHNDMVVATAPLTISDDLIGNATFAFTLKLSDEKGRIVTAQQMAIVKRNAISCASRIAHGPGHQSLSCCERTGRHTIHQVVVYPRVYRWSDADTNASGTAYTGYFDESPEID